MGLKGMSLRLCSHDDCKGMGQCFTAALHKSSFEPISYLGFSGAETLGNDFRLDDMYIKATNVVVVYLVIYSNTGLTLQAALILITHAFPRMEQ